MLMKRYLNIKEVSKIVGLKEHIIRYWDSVDPKTQKLRIDGISTKSKAGTRYFNKENINKLQSIKSLLYEDGTFNPSLKLANKIVSNKQNLKKTSVILSESNQSENIEKVEKIHQILKKIRILLK